MKLFFLTNKLIWNILLDDFFLNIRFLAFARYFFVDMTILDEKNQTLLFTAVKDTDVEKIEEKNNEMCILFDYFVLYLVKKLV